MRRTQANQETCRLPRAHGVCAASSSRCWRTLAAWVSAATRCCSDLHNSIPAAFLIVDGQAALDHPLADFRLPGIQLDALVDAVQHLEQREIF